MYAEAPAKLLDTVRLNSAPCSESLRSAPSAVRYSARIDDRKVGRDSVALDSQLWSKESNPEVRTLKISID